MSKKLSELPLTRQFAGDGTILISSANDGTKRIDLETFLDLIAGGITTEELSELTDVVINNPTDGQVLKYDEHFGKWTNGTGGGGGTSDVEYLDDLRNVRINDATLQDGQFLKYDAATNKWINGAGGGGGGASALSDLTDVNIDNVANNEGLFYDNASHKWINKETINSYENFSELPNWGIVAYGSLESRGEILPLNIFCSFPSFVPPYEPTDNIEDYYYIQKLIDDNLNSEVAQMIMLRLSAAFEYPYAARLNQKGAMLLVRKNNQYVRPDLEDTWEDYEPSDYYIGFDKSMYSNKDFYVSVPLLSISMYDFNMYFIGWIPYTYYIMLYNMQMIQQEVPQEEPENLLDFSNFAEGFVDES